MALWIGIGTVVLLCVYYFSTMNRANTRHRKRIDQIQKRLAEKTDSGADSNHEEAP